MIVKKVIDMAFVNTFDEVRANKIKSVLLIIFFILLIAFLGMLFGAYYGSAWSGLILAVFSGLFYVMIAYSFGDKMVLNMSGAKPVTKKEYPHLFHTVEGLAVAAGLPAPKAYVIQSEALNAFATGRDPQNAAIAVTTGLLKALKRQELEGVIAHEMAHIKNYDIRMMLLTSVLIGIVVMMSDFMLRSFLFGGRGKKSHPALMIVSLVFAILAPIIGHMIRLAISRKREYLADASGALLTRYPEGLASALEKIKGSPAKLDTANRAMAHLYISNPFGKVKGFFAKAFSTHPPIDDRISKLRRM